MGKAKYGRMGIKRFYDKEGRLHNENGPAVIYPNGRKNYYRHGKRHRLDGPAQTAPPNWRVDKWYIDDKFYPEDSTLVKLLKAKYGIDSICR